MILQPIDVLEGNYERFFAIKTAGTWIKKLRTQEDVDSAMGERSFFDLEGKEHQVIIGRCICVGEAGERWTSSIASVERDRFPFGEPDGNGYQLHYILHPRPIACFVLPFAFDLLTAKRTWHCETSGIVTWNGKYADELDMRVIQREIFDATYTRKVSRPDNGAV